MSGIPQPSERISTKAKPKSLARDALEVAARLATTNELQSLVKLLRASVRILKDGFTAAR
jgi:hypothetical protein